MITGNLYLLNSYSFSYHHKVFSQVNRPKFCYRFFLDLSSNTHCVTVKILPPVSECKCIKRNKTELVKPFR